MLRKILASLFPLFFIGIGGLFIIKAGFPVTKKYFHQFDLITVEASYVSGEVNWQDTKEARKRAYLTRVQYQYDYEGTSYLVEKIEKETFDTAVHKHKYKLEDLQSELEELKKEGSIQLKVDVSEPTKYQDQQEIGIAELLMSTLFPFIFILIGILILWAIFKKKPSLSIPNNQPWLNKKAWQKNILVCTTKAKRNGSIFFAFFWCAISMPMAYVLFLSGRPIENNAVYIALIFPLIGILLLISAIKKIVDYGKYGQLKLEMDPFPAAIGGDFGGILHFQRKLPAEATVAIKLNCLRLTESGSGDNRSTSEKLLWHTTGHDFVDSKDVKFRVEIPGNQEETSLTHLGIHWRAEITISFNDDHFHRQFEIPVFLTAEKSSIELDSSKHPAAKEHASELINDVTEFTKEGDNFKILFPMFRIQRVSLFFMGLIGAGILTFCAYNILHQALPIAFTIIFGLIGLAFFGIAIYEAFLSIKLYLEPNQLSAQLKWMGIPVKSMTVQKDNIFMLQIGDYIGLNEKGGKHISYHKITLINKQNEKIPVAIRLRNLSTAEQMKQFFESYYEIKTEKD